MYMWSHINQDLIVQKQFNMKHDTKRMNKNLIECHSNSTASLQKYYYEIIISIIY